LGEIAVSKMSRAFIDVRPGRESGDDIYLDLLGPLCLRDAAGVDLTPRGRKSQGLLALVAVSPALRRSRAWLQDKLWSDRPQEQGSASLRQCLTQVRASLGRHVDCLMTDRDWVALDPARVHVLAEHDQAELDDAEFLEGLDIRDAEFEHWVRDQRMRYAERHGHAPEEPVSTADPAGRSSLQPIVGLALSARDDPMAAFAELTLNLVASALLKNPKIGVMDLRHHAGLAVSSRPAEMPNWILCAGSLACGRAVRITLTLSDAAANRLRWTETATFDVAEFHAREPRSVLALAAQVVHAIQARVPLAEAGHGSVRATPAGCIDALITKAPISRRLL
jgi:hypothetical protein